MPHSAKDIQLIKLKDTISKLNELIMTQTKSMDSLQKTIEELRQELNNKQAEVDYLKAYSYVSLGLAAHVMYGKFINALPYYRQEKDFKNQFGVMIGRGTMVHWTIYCSENYFLPMIGYFHRLLTERKFVAADETPIQILKEAGRRPQSKSYV